MLDRRPKSHGQVGKVHVDGIGPILSRRPSLPARKSNKLRLPVRQEGGKGNIIP